jgi:hypothetical protein
MACIVGLGRFELPTPSPPDLYAKPLRYSPIREQKNSMMWISLSIESD